MAFYINDYIPEWLRLTGTKADNELLTKKTTPIMYAEIRQYSLDNKLIAVYKNITDAAYNTSIHRSQISMVINGHAEQKGGYKWEGITIKTL